MLECQSEIRVVGINLERNKRKSKREWDWVLVNYKLRSSYAVVGVFIPKEDRGVWRYNQA